ncbi:MAG TPA: plasmid pRiA4b ORF-3 family protein, partial [Arenicellales bacterium]|nr:plasmid pRiA4b ORF-3 family protein [Arenicellales bacterium]
VFSADEILLNQYFSQNKKMIYIYDFGDDWTHEIKLVDQDDKPVKHPVCLAGKGKAPPEDCGGIWGYYNMVEIVNDPDNEEYEDMREWMGLDEGEEWDVNEFDPERVNRFFARE